MRNTIVLPENADVVWPLVTEIGKAEREFNTLQAGYRKLASGWFLAVCGGLGFLLKSVTVPGGQESLGGRYTHLLLALGVAGWLGILVLWLVDIPVYHRLLVSYFRAGLELEKECEWMPRVRHDMVKTPAIIFATIYYVALATAAFVASWLVFSSIEAPSPWWYGWSVVVVVEVDLAVLGWALWMWSKVWPT